MNVKIKTKSYQNVISATLDYSIALLFLLLLFLGVFDLNMIILNHQQQEENGKEIHTLESDQQIKFMTCKELFDFSVL